MSKKTNANANVSSSPKENEEILEQSTEQPVVPAKEITSPPVQASKQRCWRCGARQIANGVCQNCGEHYDL